MNVRVDPQRILRYARHALPAYRGALQDAQAVFDRHGISDNALRAAHFSAQFMYESAALRVAEEDLDYRAARIAQVWPTRFLPRGPLDPAAYAHQPELLGNCVYGGRNGNTEPGDGYAFRGRGLLELTGRSGYAAATLALRAGAADAPDLCATPALAVDARWALEVAASVWVAKGCNRHADADNLLKVTRAINGGEEGLSERRIWLRWMKRAFRAPLSAVDR
jgi:putative chitinase